MRSVDKLKHFISTSDGDVFLRSEFDKLGSTAQVTRSLRLVLAEGVLVRLGLGVYARAKRSVLTGSPIPAKPLEVLAPQALRKLGIDVGAGRLTAAYNAGNTSQVPAGVVLNIGTRRIARKLGFNGKLVEYERTKT